jgi:hypothetical protein
MLSLPALERDIVSVTCAISAGIHGALVHDHFADSAHAGLGFLAAVVLLAGLVLVLTREQPSAVALALASAVLVGLLASYALAATTGVPLFHPEPEPVDGLALATKAIEAVGLVTALHLIWRGRAAAAPNVIQTKGVQA